MFTFSELFDLAIQVEVNGERFYRYAMNRVKGESLQNLLGWLADEELLHQSAFKELKQRTGRGITLPPSLASLTQQAVRRAMGRHAFSLDELQIDSIRDEKEILEAAVVFEEDTILFFEFITPFVSDQGAASTLEKIRTEELNHKQLLMEKISAI